MATSSVVEAESVFEDERELERIDRVRALVVAERQARKVRPRDFDGEGLEPGEPVQAERELHAFDPRAVARPADDRVRGSD